MSRKHSRTSIFLIEFTISLLLFSLATAVCVQLFVQSHQRSSESTRLSRSVVEAQNMAEIYRGCGGQIDETIKTLKSEYPYMETTNSTEAAAFFNKDFEHSQESDSYFMTKISFNKASEYSTMEIIITETENGTEIYSLPVKMYIGE